jgi:hypothetical protein
MSVLVLFVSCVLIYMYVWSFVSLMCVSVLALFVLCVCIKRRPNVVHIRSNASLQVVHLLCTCKVYHTVSPSTIVHQTRAHMILSAFRNVVHLISTWKVYHTVSPSTVKHDTPER